jgi:hypothetical protein
MHEARSCECQSLASDNQLTPNQIQVYILKMEVVDSYEMLVKPAGMYEDLKMIYLSL